jgi:diguanylate cyclase (GGDEF)-like protein
VRNTAEYAFARRYWLSQFNKFDSVFENYPELSIKGVTLSELSNGSSIDLRGSISAFTDVDFDHSATLSELKVILSLYPQLETIVKDTLVNRIYYLSAQEFFYVVPEIPFDEFRISQRMYDGEFWQQALPENNPTLSTFVSPIYYEALSGESMVTYINPLYDMEKFAGVIAYDIDTQNLLSLIAASIKVGDGYLLGSRDLAVNGLDSIIPFSDLSPELLSDTGHDYVVNSQGYFYAIPLIQDGSDRRLTYVHKISHQQLNSSAAKNAATFWVILLLFYLLIVIALGRHVTAQTSQRLMMIDPLTGILNRRGFENQIRPLLDKVTMHKKKYAILLADIDHFKRINDEFGHDIGDETLTLVARELESSLRGDCELARWGGEEFIIFVPNVDKQLVEKIAERLRSAVCSNRLSTVDRYLTISIGASMALSADDLQSCIKQADQALYDAKELGRNRVVMAAES